MKSIMIYDSKSTAQYLFSLVAFDAIIYFVSPYQSLNIFIYALNFYLAYFYIARFGFSFTFSDLKEIAIGILQLPIEYLIDLRHSWKSTSLFVLSFCIVIYLEFLFHEQIKPFGLSKEFPYLYMMLANLALVELYRLVVLVRHLMEPKKIQQVLSDSPIKSRLFSRNIFEHIFQAYATGVVTYIAYLIPYYIFWSLFPPTYFREISMLVVLPLIQLGAFKLFGLSFHPDFSFNHWVGFRHRREHESRFRFNVFHGHHHDTIPSGLIGGTNSGIFEALNKSFVGFQFLSGSLYQMLYKRLIAAIADILLHSYIPGIYPYTNFVISAKVHHMTHHYLGVLPYSLGGLIEGPLIEEDFKSGYKIDNFRVLWFTNKAQEYDHVSAQEAEAYRTKTGFFPTDILTAKTLAKHIFSTTRQKKSSDGFKIAS